MSTRERRSSMHCAKIFARNLHSEMLRPLWQGESYRHKKLRVAYLSADLHAHAIAFLMAGVFEQHDRTQFELPPPLLQNETRRALAELVQRGRDHGATDEMLKEKEKELIDGAAKLAAQRLKTNFILQQIAEREKIQVTKEDIDARIRQEAERYDVSPEKMRKELQQKDALNDLAEQILLGKTLDFLKANVSVAPAQEPAVTEKKNERVG